MEEEGVLGVRVCWVLKMIASWKVLVSPMITQVFYLGERCGDTLDRRSFTPELRSILASP